MALKEVELAYQTRILLIAPSAIIGPCCVKWGVTRGTIKTQCPECDAKYLVEWHDDIGHAVYDGCSGHTDVYVYRCVEVPVERQHIFHEVDAERRRQDAQWGGPEHDDEHGLEDFSQFIEQQIRKLKDTPVRLPQAEYRQRIRERFIKMAALAVAAVESADRRSGDDNGQ